MSEASAPPDHLAAAMRRRRQTSAERVRHEVPRSHVRLQHAIFGRPRPDEGATTALAALEKTAAGRGRSVVVWFVKLLATLT